MEPSPTTGAGLGDLLRRWPTSAHANDTDLRESWVSIEPTFTSPGAVQSFDQMSNQPGGEEAWFDEPEMRSAQLQVAVEMVRACEQVAAAGGEHVLFTRAEQRPGIDAYGVERHEIDFCWADSRHEPFNVRVTLDPEVIEYGTKPVPVAWLYDARFLRFMQEVLWDVPARQGMVVAMAHGGGQFHLSAKGMLRGSLIADLVAWRLNHPELSTWTLDFANRDERAFRASAVRFAAFRRAVEAWREGRFHPAATGVATAGDILSGRPFAPGAEPRPDLADPTHGVTGGPSVEFQANFAFARWLAQRVQVVEAGYWQATNPRDDGFKPAQIGRYSECNLQRVQLRGEFDVKGGRVLQPDSVPECSAPLEVAMLARDASVEHRAQASRTSAADQAEAALLELHHALWLAHRPGVTVRASLLQDQILQDAEATLRKHRPAEVGRLHQRARLKNLELSHGRIKSDAIEPEALMWAAWKALPEGERTSIAHEAVSGLVAHVEEAAAFDPRPDMRADPMEPHRHRVHPMLWKALQAGRANLAADDAVRRELEAWERKHTAYMARRPVWSPTRKRPPWQIGGH